LLISTKKLRGNKWGDKWGDEKMPFVSGNMKFFPNKNSQGGAVTASIYDSGTPTVLTP